MEIGSPEHDNMLPDEDNPNPNQQYNPNYSQLKYTKQPIIKPQLDSHKHKQNIGDDSLL